jgi:hypothetical protein
MCHLRFPKELLPGKLEPSTHRSRKGEVTLINKGGPTDTLFNQERNRLKDLEPKSLETFPTSFLISESKKIALVLKIKIKL